MTLECIIPTGGEVTKKKRWGQALEENAKQKFQSTRSPLWSFRVSRSKRLCTTSATKGKLLLDLLPKRMRTLHQTPCSVDYWPAVNILEKINTQGGIAIILGAKSVQQVGNLEKFENQTPDNWAYLVVMIHKHITITISEYSIMTRSMNRAVARHHLCSSTLHHVRACLVEIRTLYILGATNHDAISAGGTLATAIKGRPKIVVAIFAMDEWCFHGTAVVGTSGNGSHASPRALAS